MSKFYKALALIGLLIVLGMLVVNTAQAAVTIEYYPTGVVFVLQPNEGWTNHFAHHVQNVNDTGAPLAIESAPGGGSFACRGGACPPLVYHYQDTLVLGELEAGSQIQLLTILHDDVDTRRTTILRDGNAEYQCPQGMVVLNCIHIVSATGTFSIRFDDSVAVEMITVRPPTATPSNTPVPPTETPTNTAVPPTATPSNTPVPPTETPSNTPEPPTATPSNTPVPPTASPSNTPEPPTGTPTSTQTLVPSSTPVMTQTLAPTLPATEVPAPTEESDLFCPRPVPTEFVGQPFVIYWLDGAGNPVAQVWSGFVVWYADISQAMVEFRRFTLDMDLAGTRYQISIAGEYQATFELVATSPNTLGCAEIEQPQIETTCTPSGCIGDELVETLAAVTTVQLGTINNPSQLVISATELPNSSTELFVSLEGFQIYWDQGTQMDLTAQAAESYLNYENCSFAIFPMQFRIEADQVMFVRLPGQWFWTLQTRWPTEIGEIDMAAIETYWDDLDGEAFAIATLRPGQNEGEVLKVLQQAYLN